MPLCSGGDNSHPISHITGLADALAAKSQVSVITEDVHYPGREPSSGYGFTDTHTITAESGTVIGGGILRTTADAGWTGSGYQGGAKLAHNNFADGYFAGAGDPVGQTWPRPTDDGHGWIMQIEANCPRDVVAYYGMTVTYYAIVVS